MKYNFLIIGAGIVGLATALKLLEKKPNAKVIVLEKENKIAAHQTGNNSGVIHSGIYYKPGSLKAINCRKGYDQLLKFCDEHDVNYEICGKVIVAVNQDEAGYLDVLLQRGKANGLKNLKKLSAEELKEHEPKVNGIAGIFVPQTGIIDFIEVADKYKEIIEDNGGEILLNRTVKNIIDKNDKVEVITNNETFISDFVVSCAGLFSDRIAKTTNPGLQLRIIPFRGEYYKLKKDKRFLVKNLIYPVPNSNFPFLGVHFTRTINGEVEAGPNAVLAFKREGYTKTSFNIHDTFETFTWYGFLKVAYKYWKTGLGEFYRSYNKKAFVKALQKLVPEIKESDLVQGGAGVRAQACDNKGGLLDDFYIVENKIVENKIVGNKRIFHVCNAPSPAATSSLSIGEYLSNKILANFN